MATLEELRQRCAGAGEFCQTDLWPLVEIFQRDYAVDYSGIKSKAVKFGPLLVGGWLLQTMIPRSAGMTMPMKVLTVAGSIAFVIALAVLLYEVWKFFGLAVKRLAALQKLKSEIKSKSMSFLEPSFKYSSQAEFPVELYKSSGLFPSSYDRALAEDRCRGKIGETDFDLVEVKTYDVKKSRDSKGRQTVKHIAIFTGLLLKADFNKNIDGHTVIQTDGAEDSFGFLARGAQRLMSSMSNLKLVELENPDFEKHFKVRSTDPNAARYILSPSFMEQVVQLKLKYQVDIQLSFRETSVVIAVPHRADFMAMKGGVEDLTVSVEGLLRELVDVLGIIEDLQLNNRIWNKSSQSVGA